MQKEYRVFVWAWKNPFGRMAVCIHAKDESDATQQALGLACKLTRKKSDDFLALAGETYEEMGGVCKTTSY